MNFDATNKLDKQIENLNDDEVKERIYQAKDQDERDFWYTIYDRALQIRQKKIVNQEGFIR